jgi:peptidoglycan/LPS O-acetylase OafA/YrhL
MACNTMEVREGGGAAAPGARPCAPLPVESTNDGSPGTGFRLGHRPELDGLRGLAVLSVMAVHTPQFSRYVPGGFLGVDLFLVLSGFLITCLLVEEHARRGSIRLRLFYARRALRLLPALWVLLGALALLALYSDVPWAAQISPKTIFRGELLVLCAAGNWAWLFRVDLFVLSHAWTLGLEEQFYLLWPPLLALLLSRRVRRRRVILLVAACILVVAALRTVLWQRFVGLRYSLITSSMATRADALLVGCLVGLLACWNCLPRRGGWGHLALQAAGLASLLPLAYLWVHVQPGAASLYFGGFTLTAAACALLLAAAVSDPPRLVSRLLGAPPLAGLGRLAYGLYLWHFPVFGLLSHFVHKVWPSYYPGTRVDLALKFAVSFAAALLSFYCVERPFLRWKARLARA